VAEIISYVEELSVTEAGVEEHSLSMGVVEASLSPRPDRTSEKASNPTEEKPPANNNPPASPSANVSDKTFFDGIRYDFRIQV
jgi:hypothetical protein